LSVEAWTNAAEVSDVKVVGHCEGRHLVMVCKMCVEKQNQGFWLMMSSDSGMRSESNVRGGSLASCFGQPMMRNSVFMMSSGKQVCCHPIETAAKVDLSEFSAAEKRLA